MSDIVVAAVLAGTVLLASTISVKQAPWPVVIVS
jgi:hypothetical protein